MWALLLLLFVPSVSWGQVPPAPSNLAVTLGTAIAGPCYQGFADVPCTPTLGDPAILRVIVVDSASPSVPPLQYQTIQAAIAASLPGDYIQVKNGVYPAGPRANFMTSGTREHPITLINYPGHAPLVQHGIEISSAQQWIIVQGLEIRNVSGEGMNIDDLATHIAIRDNWFFENGTVGIFGRPTGILIDHNVFERNGFGPGDCAIAYICNNAPGGPDHCTSNLRYSHCHGIYLSSNTGGAAPRDNSITRNKFLGNSGSGFQVQGGQPHYHYLFENNIFVNEMQSIWGLGLAQSTIRNNTIVDLSNQVGVLPTLPRLVGVTIANGGTNSQIPENIFKNNALYIAGASNITQMWTFVVSPLTNPPRLIPTMNHNAYYFVPGTCRAGGACFSLDGGNCSTDCSVDDLDMATQYVPYIQDTTSLLGPVSRYPNNANTPQFVNLANDLHAIDLHLLSGSPLIGKGDPADCPQVDLDGNPRIAGQCDIGAFGFGANLLHPSDLVYDGSFRVPATGTDYGYSGWTGTFSANGNGGIGSLIISDNVRGVNSGVRANAMELSIPPLVKGGDVAWDVTKLNRATHITGPFDVSSGLIASLNVNSLLRNDELRALLYDPPYLYYMAGKFADNSWSVRYGTIGRADAALSSNMHSVGHWQADDQPPLKTARYFLKIPQAFADKYLGGRNYGIGGNDNQGDALSSWGPNLYALNLPAGATVPADMTVLPLTTLLEYPFSSDPTKFHPQSNALTSFIQVDEFRGAWWATSPSGKQAVIFYGIKGMGWECYGYTSRYVTYDQNKNSAGPKWGQVTDTSNPADLTNAACFDPCQDVGQGRLHGWPYVFRLYFYDPADLALVAQGKKQPWEPQPYAIYDPPELQPSKSPNWGGITPYSSPGYPLTGPQYGGQCKQGEGALMADDAHGAVFILGHNMDTVGYNPGAERPIIHRYHLAN